MSGRDERMAELAAEELRLARAGDFDALPGIQAERQALMGAPVSRRVLEQTAALQAEIVSVLEASRAETARELALLRRGRSAVRAYGQVGVR
jgi:hypothetical protein